MRRYLQPQRLVVTFFRGFVVFLFCVCIFPETSFGITHDFQTLREGFQSSEAILLDRKGRKLHSLRWSFKSRKLNWTNLDEISPSLTRAIIGAEDRRFFEHNGVDILAVGGAVRDYLQGKRLRGASTITMQLASLLEPALRAYKGARTLGQKFNQSQSALEIEESWSKSEILEAYLNMVTFRGELQGVAAASMGLFQKAPDQLLRTEALLLAVLVRSPNASPKLAGKRACRLAEYLNWTVACKDLHTLSKETLSRPYYIPKEQQLAPHLAERLVSERESWSPIATTIDSRIQEYSIRALRNQLAMTSKENMNDGAVIVLDNRSGDVLAYVGSVGMESKAPHVDAVRARRQAGSTLKPFLYALALQRRILTASTEISDAPFEHALERGIYAPTNYDNLYRDKVSVREALGSSLNIPAVRTLTMVGQEAFARTLRDLGISITESANFYGPSLALGSLDVSLWELTNAYRTLAQSGVWSGVRLSLEEQGPNLRRRVFSFGTSFIISDILSDRGSRHRTFGLESALSTKFWTAVKTGTSQDMRDNWCIGYSDRYTVGVWTGNVDGEPSWNVSGVEGAAPIWVSIMSYLHQEESKFRTPASELPSLISKNIVRKPVKFANRNELEWYLKGTEPSYTFKVQKNRAWRRIVYPTGGMVIAIDPDIPETKQRVVFRSDPKDARLEWRLNGRRLDDAAQPYLWQPETGTHELELYDSSRGIAVDSIRFDVR